VALLLSLGYLAFRAQEIRNLRNSSLEKADNFDDAPLSNQSAQSIDDVANMNTSPQVETLPASIFLSVPYTRQAPFSIWDALHEDACEEASIIMVRHYLEKSGIESKQAADNEITDLVSYQEKNGYGISISLEQLLAISREYYGVDGYIIRDASIDNIKRELTAGNPIIMPFAGKLLPNPYFRNGGPIYHMLVVIGYDDKNFITNDPGTMKGDGMKYSYADILKSNHDWVEPDILQGQKGFLVLTK